MWHEKRKLSEFKFTSFSSSVATARCLMSGCDNGDSRRGSSGSNGDIKWARMHIFGSEISRTDKVLGLYVGSFVSDATGSCNGNFIQLIFKKFVKFVKLYLNYLKRIFEIHNVV